VSGAAQQWPPALAGTPAAAVIERAIERRRLGHSLLLHGDDPGTLVAAAYAIADRLLNPGHAPGPARHQAADGTHPDCFELRPAGRSRQIGAEATRELITRLQVTASVAAAKVAILHEADRMNPSASNIFLKTLEEPPPNTTILLLTSHPYALLSTIRSRCLHFRLSTAAQAADIEGWKAWLDDYRAWLARLLSRAPDRSGVADHVFSVYGLLARFGRILEKAAAEAWAVRKADLPPGLEEEEEVAMQVGLANGIRSQLFAEIERATRTFAIPHLGGGGEAPRRAFVAAIERLEHDAGLLRLNFNESAALEDFLLASLRLWSKRP
jgi:DNA polymerase-3 subunit delta'